MSTISNDYIRREDAIDKINERQRKLIYCFGFENDAVKIMDIAKSIVTAIPAADVVPVIHGRWIPYRCDMYECSVCQRIHTSFDSGECDADYCPNCGAKMDIEE